MQRTYEANGRVATVALDGTVVADMTAPGAYDAARRPNVFTYGNGTRSDDTGIARDSLGRTTALTWETSANTLSTSSGVTNRSLGGQIRDDTVDGTDVHVGDNDVYDARGRLTAAWAGTHGYTYDFADSACPVTGVAGRNTNRSSQSVDGGPPRRTATTWLTAWWTPRPTCTVTSPTTPNGIRSFR